MGAKPLTKERRAEIERLIDPAWGQRPIYDVIKELLDSEAFYREALRDTMLFIISPCPFCAIEPVWKTGHALDCPWRLAQED